MTWLFVRVDGSRSFLCSVARAPLCCHLNTDTQPDSTYSAAAATANQEIVGRTNERENESSRHNDTAEIQVKTQHLIVKMSVFFNNAVTRCLSYFTETTL